MLGDLAAKRTADGVTDRYYYGVLHVTYTSGVAGLGYVGFPAAIGWDYNSGPNVLAHEVGHNFGRQHSPCGNPANPDPNYPYPGAIIGVPGWDAFATTPTLKTSSGFTDIMGYCSPQWVSDYTYKGVLTFRANSSFGFVAPDVAGSDQEGLLVWGRIVNGQMILEPAFRVSVKGNAPEAGPYTWEARDSLGQVLTSVSFDAPEVADMPNTDLRIFSFVVPFSPSIIDSVYSVHVMNNGKELARVAQRAALPRVLSPAAVSVQHLPNHQAQLTWNAQQYPVVMVRDAQTGEIRGFLRDGSASIDDEPATMELQVSDGIHAATVSQQGAVQ